MISTRESVAEFVKSQINTLGGITTPDIRFSVRSNQQPPEFPNCLNLYFYDDPLVRSDLKTNPAWRLLGASFELLIAIDPAKPLVADRYAYTACHLINQFMAVQAIPKKDYSVTPAVNLNSSISWRDSYPLEWSSAANEDERYVHKTAFLQIKYFEQPLVVV